MFVETNLYRKLFHFHRWESVRVFINGIGKLDFLHLSQLVTAKFLNVSISQVMLCFVKSFTVTLSMVIGFCNCFMN